MTLFKQRFETAQRNMKPTWIQRVHCTCWMNQSLFRFALATAVQGSYFFSIKISKTSHLTLVQITGLLWEDGGMKEREAGFDGSRCALVNMCINLSSVITIASTFKDYHGETFGTVLLCSRKGLERSLWGEKGLKRRRYFALVLCIRWNQIQNHHMGSIIKSS